MKIATFNVNGRVDLLRRGLEKASLDIVCLQELKSPDNRFRIRQIGKAGYGAIRRGQRSWNGVAIPAKGMEPLLTRKDLPEDREDIQSRYIEAAVDGPLADCRFRPSGVLGPGRSSIVNCAGSTVSERSYPSCWVFTGFF